MGILAAIFACMIECMLNCLNAQAMFGIDVSHLLYLCMFWVAEISMVGLVADATNCERPHGSSGQVL